MELTTAQTHQGTSTGNLTHTNVRVLKEKQPTLSGYMDFREYLKDFYSYKRNNSISNVRPYTYVEFSAAAAGIKSPRYLKLIIQGKRNLSDQMIARFSKALGLEREDIQEFRLLVLFNQEFDSLKRPHRLRELMEFRFQKNILRGEIDLKLIHKVPNWITWVVFAIFDQKDVEFEEKEIQSLLKGYANNEDIAESLNRLIESGILERIENSLKIKKTSKTIEIPEEIPSELIRKIQSELMYLGFESLYREAPTDREFGSLTLALTRDEFEDLKFKLRQWRKQIHKDISIKRGQTRGTQVYQLNLQLFPISKKF